TSEQTLSQRLERQTQEKQEQTSLEIRQIQNELTQINDTLKNFIGLISSKINRESHEEIFKNGISDGMRFNDTRVKQLQTSFQFTDSKEKKLQNPMQSIDTKEIELNHSIPLKDTEEIELNHLIPLKDTEEIELNHSILLKDTEEIELNHSIPLKDTEGIELNNSVLLMNRKENELPNMMLESQANDLTIMPSLTILCDLSEKQQVVNEVKKEIQTKPFINQIPSQADVCSLVEFNNSEAPPGCLKNSSLFPTPTNPPSVPKKRNETSGLGIAKSRPDTNRLGNRFVITTLNTKSNDASISQFSDIGRHEITSGNKELRAVETIHQLELEEPSVHNCFTIESSQTFAKNHTIFCTNYYSTEPVPCKVCICLHFDKMNRLNVQACVSPDSVNTKWPVFLVGEGEIYNPATKKFSHLWTFDSCRCSKPDNGQPVRVDAEVCLMTSWANYKKVTYVNIAQRQFVRDNYMRIKYRLNAYYKEC
ncbi:hypothetical protein BgiBS90_015783, partial [Biomphalaria glabrata]